MAKNRCKKQSKRVPAKRRYKIEKRVREHNRKARREAKKNPKTGKPKTIEIPNGCPFKDQIIQEVELMKQHKEEEKKKLRERQKAELANGGLELLAKQAEIKGNLYESLSVDATEDVEYEKNVEQSLKQYYKEFRAVIEAADVILEVVDARDPLGTRCKQVHEAVTKNPNSKRLVLILNKADLVPRPVLEKWLKYFKRRGPVVPFKASVQNQVRNLGQRKFNKSANGLQGSASIGAELVMSLLANYCRNKGISSSITVGVVGLPNVGKSSIINSLKRGKVCNVGATPGVTRAAQIVQLDSKIRLLDSPGIVFAKGNDSQASLRNAVKVSALDDPITPANAILQRVSKEKLMDIYDVTDFSSPDEFYSLKAARTGKLKKGGIPDRTAAAKGLLEDWNSGKIPYYTVPPEEETEKVSLKIISEIGKEFDLDSLELMETDALNKIKVSTDDKHSFRLDSLGPVDVPEEKMEEDTTENQLLDENFDVAATKKDKSKPIVRKSKKATDPEMALEGNQQLNKIKKKQFKKEKKEAVRRDKVAQQLSEGLDNFSLISSSKDEDYDFSEYFEKQ